jgi:CheY-like chemotaxis protein
VDDDRDNLDLIREQVSLLIDCSVVTALDGNTALSLAKKLHPNLILLDIWLPGLDGFQVVQHLKQDPQTGVIPVIAVTAAARFQEQTMTMPVGFVDYICKPYDLETLEAAIAKCLAHSLPIATKEVTGGCHCN